MLVNLDLNFVYYHCNKTAGTSLTKLLSSAPGSINLRRRWDMKLFAQQYPEFRESAYDLLRALRGRNIVSQENLNYWQHLPPWVGRKFLRKVLGKTRARQLLTISSVRNPWDRILSHFFWRVRGFKKYNECPHLIPQTEEPKEIREKFLLWFKELAKEHRGVIPRFESEWFHYTESGKNMIQYMICYESLLEDIRALEDKLEYCFPGKLPHSKGKVRPRELPHFSFFFDDWSRDLVAKWNPKTIEKFGYEFEKPKES